MISKKQIWSESCLRKRRQRQAILILLLLILCGVLLTMLFIREPGAAHYSKGAICLDAGHGAEYTGAVYEGRQEKDDTLRIAKEVRNVLERQGQKVLMTRDGDDNIGLKERTDLANRYRASVFVSLHRNSGSGKGVEIWVEHTQPEPDTTLANNILTELEKAGIQENRGVKFGYRENHSNADYSVNRESEMPSCLVELGFMQNEVDNQFFDDHLHDYAVAIARGIMKTFGIPFDESEI